MAVGPWPRWPGVRGGPAAVVATGLAILVLVAVGGAPRTGCALDLDGSGTSDVLEMRFGGALLSPDGDEDGDGRPNRWELLWGTDPFSAEDSGSLVALEPTPPEAGGGPGGGAHLLRWRAAAGALFEVLRSGDLVAWEPLGEPIEAVADEVVVALEAGALAGRLLVRVRPLDPLDRDGDGLDAIEEAVLGTSDFDPDSDGDGRSDALEWVEGNDPLEPADGVAAPAAESGPLPMTGLEVFHPLPAGGGGRP